jgi:preprotein translocase subunit YajC
MNSLKNIRLITPLLVVAAGVFYLMNPDTDPALRTFWWFLTPFALLIWIFRFVLLRKQKKSEEPTDRL